MLFSSKIDGFVFDQINGLEKEREKIRTVSSHPITQGESAMAALQAALQKPINTSVLDQRQKQRQNFEPTQKATNSSS